MRKSIILIASIFLTVVPVFAALDIVQTNGEEDEPFYVLKNTSTGKVLGTFWDRANEKSDYGFESSISPTFVWSPDRDYVAVGYGNPRATAVCLYRVAGNSLKEIPIPSLSAEQSAPIDAITDTAATGTDIVRWQTDGTLLLRFWAAEEVKSEDQVQREPSVWADIEVSGGQARIVGTSIEEPSTPPAGMFPNPASPAGETLASIQPTNSDHAAPAEDDGFPAKGLVGIHRVTGKNPDGSTYEGTVEIRLVDGVIGMEWKTGTSVSRGNGLWIGGKTLGVALDDGMAIYSIVGQSDGQSLVGFWSGAGSAKAQPETILIGNPDITEMNFPAEPINGNYVSLRVVDDGQIETDVVISGGDLVKTVLLKSSGKATKCQGLALNGGLAFLTPAGISVLHQHFDHSGATSLVGKSLARDGRVTSESLSRSE